MVAFDAVGPSSAGAGSATSPITWSHTNSAAGNAIVVSATWSSGGTAVASAVTYGGVALARLGSQASNASTSGGIEVWGKVGGLPTGANTVSVTTTTSANQVVCGSLSFTSAGSFGTPVTGAPAGNATSASVSITSAASSMVAAAACTGSGGTFTTTAPGTQRYSRSGDNNSAADNTVGGTWAGTGSAQTVQFNNTVADWWGVVAVEVVDAGGAAAQIPMLVMARTS